MSLLDADGSVRDLFHPMGCGPMSHLHHVATLYKECSLVLHDGTPLIRTNPLIRPKCSICQSRQAIAGKEYSQARARLSTMYGGRKRRKVSAISHITFIAADTSSAFLPTSSAEHEMSLTPPATQSRGWDAVDASRSDRLEHVLHG